MRSCPKCRSTYSVKVERCGIDGERLVEVAVDPLIGQPIDRYRVVSRLGSGAMGCVYLARHSSIDREFAIKVLFGEMASDHEIAERFRREAQSLSQIDHPNIVSVVDFGTTQDGLLYLVMELVRGSTLSALIRDARAKGMLSRDRVARITRQIAAGLAEAHRLGFVHRDLKPANIIVSAKGQDEFVKILDFGIVGIVSNSSEESTGSSLTKTGYMMGTPAYMAPEQIGHPRVGKSADLYALGAMLYEMLGGRPPFLGPLRDVLARKLSSRPEPLQPAGALEQLAMALLEREPSKRPQSAEDVIQEIDRIQHGAGTLYPRTWSTQPEPQPLGAVAPAVAIPDSVPPIPDTKMPSQAILTSKSGVPDETPVEIALSSMSRNELANLLATTRSKRLLQTAIAMIIVAFIVAGLAALYVYRDQGWSTEPKEPEWRAVTEPAPVPTPIERGEQPGPKDGALPLPIFAGDTRSAGDTPPPIEPKGGPLKAPPAHSALRVSHKSAAGSKHSPARDRTAPPPPGPEVREKEATRIDPTPAIAKSARAAETPNHGTITILVKNSVGREVRAGILIDGQDRVLFSPLTKYPLPPGTHQIKINAAGSSWRDERQVVIKANEDKPVTFIVD